MFNAIRYISLISLLFLLSETGNAQRTEPADVINYLKQKIEILYVDNPNSISNFSQSRISTDAIAGNTDGNIFGTAGNNQMNTSAGLLLALFKDRNNGGDGTLQDIIYLMLKVKDKKLYLHFINDVRAAITFNGFLFTGIDTVSRGGGLRVLPSIYNLIDAEGAGNVLIGEYLYSGRAGAAKKLLMQMVSNSLLSSYRLYNEALIASFQTTRYPGIDFFASNAMMDNRYLTDQGIVNAIYSSFTENGMNDLYNWMKRPTMILLRRLPTDAGEGLTANWILNQRGLNGISLAMSATPTPPVPATFATNYGWVNFSSEDGASIPSKTIYKIRNENTQGIIFDFCIRAGSFQSFLQAVQYSNNRYRNAPVDSKMATMLDNISQVLKGTADLQTLRTNPPRNKCYLAPVALVHFLKGSPDIFTYNDFSVLVGPGYSEEIFNLYTADIRARIRAMSASIHGEINWLEIRNQLKEILGSTVGTN